ncbi:MAG: GNAT family N-acetyltransferase [Pseudobacteriovorax sp.]|nr:GNAT family N-acetyltransferase [Pseudobacteriovorax sp.]
MIIKSHRLTMVPISLEFEESFVKILTDVSVMKYDFNGPLSDEEARELFRFWLDKKIPGEIGVKAILNADSEFVGYCGVLPSTVEDCVEHELDYRILPKFAGKGYAEEAASAYVQHMKKETTIHDLISMIKPYQSTDIGAAQRIGMRFDKEICIEGRRNHLYRVHLLNT